MIVGAQKAATSSLFEFLASAPSIVGAKPKEPHYFSTTDDWQKNLPAYHRIYGDRSAPIRCEASTSYTFLPHRKLDLWRDIRAYNPDMKIMYVVRRPVDRILSHYRHSVRRGYAHGDIRRFVLEYPLPLAICRYYTQILPFIETFGRDRVMLLEFEEVTAIPQATRRSIARFLGISEEEIELAPKVHANRSEHLRHHRLRSLPLLGRPMAALFNHRMSRKLAAATMPTDLAAAIERSLEVEVRALEGLMDRDLASWRTSL